MTEKRTFKVGDTVNCLNYKMKDFLISYAADKGVPIFFATANFSESFDEWPNLTIGGTGTLCSNRSGIGDDTRSWIPIRQFIEYCDNWKECMPHEISINDEYTATIMHDIQIVSIGCQNIPFSKVSEVYHACFPEAAQPIFENE